MKYKDPEWLHEQYHQNYRSLYELADECGVTEPAVRYQMEKHDIERRRPGGKQKLHASFGHQSKGYERWTSYTQVDDGPTMVAVHRLAAVAWFGLDAVVGMDVHHRDPEGENRPGIPWDNREEILEPMEHGEHRSYHRKNE